MVGQKDWPMEVVELLVVSMNRLKGIVFDINKKEFNVLKDCKDFNEFLTSHQLENVKCENKKIDIITVRENINKIIR